MEGNLIIKSGLLDKKKVSFCYMLELITQFPYLGREEEVGGFLDLLHISVCFRCAGKFHQLHM